MEANQTTVAYGFVSADALTGYFNRLAQLPFSALSWPLGPPSGEGCLGDLTAEDHVILATTSRSIASIRSGLRCRVSAIIYEPPMIQARWYRLLRLIGPVRFHRVFTHLPALAAAIPNGRLVPHGGSMVRRDVEAPPAKTGLVSIVASRLNSLPGHRLRHRIVAWSQANDVGLEAFGTGYRPLPDKWDGHAPFRFSVVIENSRSPGYFTEKIVDSLLAWSIPIYWGDPDVGRVFQPEGMIACESEEELRDRIASLSPADFDQRLPALAENRRRARLFASAMFERAVGVLAEECDAAGDPGSRRGRR